MKIKFKETCELEVITSYNEDTEEISASTEVFAIGEVVDVDVVDINWDFKTSTIQFGDGSVSYGVPLHVYDVIELPS